MVVGNGMVARKFLSYKTNNDFLIFASGVSNSKTSDPATYKREIELLESCMETNPKKTVVYFICCSPVKRYGCSLFRGSESDQVNR